MAIITNASRTKRAIDFFTKNLYFGFGRTSVWTDELLPDAPELTTVEVEELLFISKITDIQYVTVGGVDIVFKDTSWTKLVPATDQDLYDANVSNLYIETILDYDDYELASFRQIGLLEDPLDDANESCDLSQYDDSVINSQGVLHYLDNRIVTNRQLNQLETISIILEF